MTQLVGLWGAVAGPATAGCVIECTTLCQIMSTSEIDARYIVSLVREIENLPDLIAPEINEKARRVIMRVRTLMT